jgi:hypothetical protein
MQKKNEKKNLPLGELCRLSRRTSKLGSEFGDVAGRCKKKEKKKKIPLGELCRLLTNLFLLLKTPNVEGV